MSTTAAAISTDEPAAISSAVRSEVASTSTPATANPARNPACVIIEYQPYARVACSSPATRGSSAATTGLATADPTPSSTSDPMIIGSPPSRTPRNPQIARATPCTAIEASSSSRLRNRSTIRPTTGASSTTGTSSPAQAAATQPAPEGRRCTMTASSASDPPTVDTAAPARSRARSRRRAATLRTAGPGPGVGPVAGACAGPVGGEAVTDDQRATGAAASREPGA